MTDIKTDIWGNISFDFEELFNVPWIYLCLSGIQSIVPRDGEMERLNKYIASGDCSAAMWAP